MRLPAVGIDVRRMRIGVRGRVTVVDSMSVPSDVSIAYGMTVAADTMQLVTGGVVPVMASMTTGEAQERHRCHARGAQNDTEYVEVHLSAHVVRGSLQQSADPRIPDENSYGDSVLRVSAAQLNS